MLKVGEGRERGQGEKDEERKSRNSTHIFKCRIKEGLFKKMLVKPTQEK